MPPSLSGSITHGHLQRRQIARTWRNKCFEFILRVLKSSKISEEWVILPKSHNVDLKFANSLHRNVSARSSWWTASVDIFALRGFSQHEPTQVGFCVSRKVGLSLIHLRRKLPADSSSVWKKFQSLFAISWLTADIPPWNTCPASQNWDISERWPTCYSGNHLLEVVGICTLSHVAQEALYSPEQEETCSCWLSQGDIWMHKALPQSFHVSPTLKPLDMAYAYPVHNLRDRILDEWDWGCPGENYEWCLKFSGESWATKKGIEDFSSRNGDCATSDDRRELYA